MHSLRSLPPLYQVQQGLARQRWPKGLLDDVPLAVQESKHSKASIQERDAVDMECDARDLECDATHEIWCGYGV